MVAAWQGVGFVHGVCNTDNFSILGETIDYGCTCLLHCNATLLMLGVDLSAVALLGEARLVCLRLQLLHCHKQNWSSLQQ
jgi:hypothetical protein